jgi:hypothetical protein
MNPSSEKKNIPDPPIPPTPPKTRVVYDDDRLARKNRACDCRWFVCVCGLKEAFKEFSRKHRASGGYQPDRPPEGQGQILPPPKKR